MAVDTNILPAPDDLAGWKAAEGVLGDRIVDRVESSHLITSTSLRRYFGCKNEGYLLEEYANSSVMHAFMTWLVNDYRPALRSPDKRRNVQKTRQRQAARRGKTLAEKLLAGGLPAAEAKILEACSRTHPSIFRVALVEPGISLVVEDALLGGERLIHDKLLSGCVKADWYLTGRASPVGQFHFFSVMGPPLPSFLSMEAAEYLASLGVEMTRKGLLREADKFGWLWDWYDDRSAEDHTPELRNTDGEELIWQTASFSVSDEAAARKALAARDDMDYDDESDEYLWFRYQGRDAMIPGDILHLEHMRFVGDELILEVNSPDRLEVARQWLAAIPGVAFLAVETRDLHEDPRDIPMDDRMGPKDSVALAPEMASYLQETFRRHYMEWLDSSLPILNGKTPRQACETKDGRRKVALLIRTIPTPLANAPVSVDAPRKEMLRELGLE